MTKKELAIVLREKLGLLDWKPATMGGNIWFERKTEKNQLERIMFSLYSASDGFEFATSISGYKDFPEVENILSKYYAKFDIRTQQITIRMGSKRDETLFLDVIHSIDEIDKFIPRLKKMVHEEVMPFFNAYQTIEQVNEKMKSLEKSDVSQFVFLPHPLRVLVIKKLVNASDFLEYGDWLIGVANSMQEPEKPAYAIVIPELFEELKQMKV